WTLQTANWDTCSNKDSRLNTRLPVRQNAPPGSSLHPILADRYGIRGPTIYLGDLLQNVILHCLTSKLFGSIESSRSILLFQYARQAQRLRLSGINSVSDVVTHGLSLIF